MSSSLCVHAVYILYLHIYTFWEFLCWNVKSNLIIYVCVCVWTGADYDLLRASPHLIAEVYFKLVLLQVCVSYTHDDVGEYEWISY